MKQLIFNNQQKIQKKRKGKKRKGGKGKGNEMEKNNFSFIKGFLTENRNHVHQQKKITTPPFKKQTKKKP